MRRGPDQRPLRLFPRLERAARLAARLAAAVGLVTVGAAAGPGQVALDFLAALPGRSASLEEATALSPETTDVRRREIGRRLDVLAASIRSANLEIVEVREKPPLAGVLVGQTDVADPTAVNVHAVAMLERDGRWRPAPLPASFDNTGTDYLPGLAEPVRELEHWLRLESAALLEKLRQRSMVRLAAMIDAVPPPPARPDAVAMSFLATLADRESVGYLPRAMKLLGGIDLPPTDAQLSTLHLLLAARRDPEARAPRWAVVAPDEALHAVIGAEITANRAIVRIGSYLPSSGEVREPRSFLLVFELHRAADDAPWILEFPSWLSSPQPLEAPSPIDSHALSALPAALLVRHPSKPQPAPEALAAEFLHALSAGGLRSLIPLVARPDTVAPREILAQLDDLQSNFQPGGTLLPLSLAVRREGADACLLVADFDSRRPDIRRNLIRRFHLRETDGGWLLHPILDQSQLELPPPLAAWADEQEALTLAQWLPRLTGHDGLAASDLPPPPADAARACVDAWLTGGERKNLASALSVATWMPDERGPQNLLRQLSQEAVETGSHEILGVHEAAPWTAVSVRHRPVGEAAPYLLLYPVIATPAGPRLLAEAALFHPDTRSRNFLNLAALKRLSRLIDPDAHAALENLLAEHSKLAAP